MSQETKVCPRCSNVIRADAKQCRFCSAQFVVTVHGLCPNGDGLMKATENGRCPLCNAPLDGCEVESQLVSAPTLPRSPGRPADALPTEPPSDPSLLARQKPANHAVPVPGAAPSPLLNGKASDSAAEAQAIAQLEAALNPPQPVDLHLGGYSQGLLQADERPVYRARRHPAGLIMVVVNLACGAATLLGYRFLDALPASWLPQILNILPYSPGAMVGQVYRPWLYVFFVVAFLFMLAALSELVGLLFSELVVTDKRILGRYGGLLLQKVDIALPEIVTIMATHAISPFKLGRLMVAQTNQQVHLFVGLSDPLEFRRQVESQFAPGPRPALEKASFASTLVTILLALIFLASSAGLIYLATSGAYHQFLPPTPVTFDAVGQYPVGRRVVIEGVLRMPAQTSCREACFVLLSDPADPDRTLAIFVSVPAAGEPGPNQMPGLADDFTPADFRVICDDGTPVGDGASLRLTGAVCRTTSGSPCVDQIELIELRP